MHMIKFILRSVSNPKARMIVWRIKVHYGLAMLASSSNLVAMYDTFDDIINNFIY